MIISVALVLHICNFTGENEGSAEKKIVVKVLNDREYYEELIKWIDRANKSIHVIMYIYKTDTDTIEFITEKIIVAARRGVEVKIVLEGSQDVNDLAYNRLMRNKVQVKYDSRAHTTHSKLIIIDGYIVMVGSHNWTKSAMTVNHESSVLIISESIGEQEEKYFNEVWKYG